MVAVNKINCQPLMVQKNSLEPTERTVKKSKIAFKGNDDTASFQPASIFEDVDKLDLKLKNASEAFGDLQINSNKFLNSENPVVKTLKPVLQPLVKVAYIALGATVGFWAGKKILVNFLNAKVLGKISNKIANTIGITGVEDKILQLSGKMVDGILVVKNKIYNYVPTDNKVRNFVYATAKKAGLFLSKWSEKGLVADKITPQAKASNLVYKTVGNAIGTVTAYMAGKKIAKAEDDETRQKVVQSYVTRAATMGILD